MKVKATSRFYDRELKETHEQGDEFETSKGRAEKLKNMGFVEEIKTIKPGRKEGETVKA